MTDPTTRELITDLLAALKSWSPTGGGPLEGAEEEYEAALIAKAEAFLDQPEPEGPTAAELSNLWRACSSPSVFARAVLARWGRPVFRQKELTDEQLLKCFKIATPCYNMEDWRRELDGMRAAIAADRALCARPAIKPVPVSERLPGPEDCDKEQALLALSHLLDAAANSMDTTEPAYYIRRALGQLSNEQ
jgi:hypothetical protein